MSKRTVFIIIFIIGVLVIIFALLGVRKKSSFSNINALPKGSYISQCSSPDGKYLLESYLCYKEGKKYNRIELFYNNTKANIYWARKKKKLTMKWINDDDIAINGHIIDLPEGRYFNI